jgi:tripartite-type tricarboxylate transporter receptor subunit TctC
MITRLARRGLLFGLGASVVSATFGPTDALADDFYQGKTLTVIIGFAPGGGVDTAGRLLARQIVRFIPGHPSLIVKNMEGAAGVVAANHLAQRIEPDGLTLAVPGRSWFVEGLVKAPNVAFDPVKFGYIGSGGVENEVLRVRSDTGIKSFDDLKSTRTKIVFGSLGSGTATAMVPHMLAATGLPIQVVLGYGSTTRVLLALEQGEVNAVILPEESFAFKQNLIQDKILVPLLQTRPAIEGVPLVRDVLPPDRAPLLSLVNAPDSFGLMLVGPPGMPPERLEVLRKAFVAMTADKEYQAEAAKINLPVEAPLNGTQLTTMIHDLSQDTTADVISAFERLKAQR